MLEEINIIVEDYSEKFNEYNKYMKANDWSKSDDVDGWDLEHTIVSDMMKNLNHFKSEIGEEMHNKKVQDFFIKSVKIIKKHIERTAYFLEEFKWSTKYESRIRDVKSQIELMEQKTITTEREEKRYIQLKANLESLHERLKKDMIKHSEIYTKTNKIKIGVSQLNVESDSEKGSTISMKLFFNDTKATLYLREFLCKHSPIIKSKVEALPISFNVPHVNPSTSKEFLINMNPKDIPPYDPTKHFFEQPLSTIQFWEEERIKNTKGITIGGYFIHPWLYYHLNSFKIASAVESDDEPVHPDFRDNEYFFAEMLKEAEEVGNVGLLMYGSRRISKALKNSELIYRSNGTQCEISNLKVGDSIIGGDGKPTLVKGVYPQGEVQLYKVTFADGRSVECCDEHLWEVYDLQANKYKTLPLKEIIKSYKYDRIHNGNQYKDGVDRIKKCYNFYIPLLKNPIDYDNTTTPFINPYYLGLWLGDGESKSTRLTTIDDEIIDYCKNKLTNSYDISVKYNEKYQSLSIKGNKYGVNDLLNSLKSKNLIGNKHIPNECFYWDIESKFELVRGLMDTDGTISNNGDISFSNTNYDIIHGLERLIRELGIGCKLSKEQNGSYIKKDGKLNTYYKLTIYTDKPIFKLIRKLDRLKPNNNRNESKRNKTAIIDVSPTTIDKATCIRVDNEDKLFLTTDCIVTHNTTTMSSYISHKLATILNASCKAIGFTKEPDLESIIEYISVANLNMHPALSINANNLDFDNGVQLGVKITPQKRLDYSKLMMVNLEGGTKKSATQKTAGGTPNGFLFDEVGKGACIKPWNSARPSFAKGDGKWRTVPLLSGTAGESSVSADAEKMLKNPEGYALLPMNWDLLERHVDPEWVTWNKGEKFAMFVPAQMSLEAGSKLTKTFADFLGLPESSPLNKIKIQVTDWARVSKMFKDRREALKTDLDLQTAECNSFPITPEDCYLTPEKNKYPGMKAKKRKEFIIKNGEDGVKVRFQKNHSTGLFDIVFSDEPTIDVYPYEGGNFDAPIVITEILEEGHVPPLGLYCMGFDDVKHDKSDGDSVISATIFKRSYEGGEWANRIVAWYHSRPEKKEYYKNLFALMKYYNCRVLAENEDNGFLEYLEDLDMRNGTNHVLTHISEGVGLASEDNLNRNKNRKFGWSPTPNNIYHLENKVVVYTKQDGLVVGDREDLEGIDLINDPMLLEELFRYKKGINLDRLRSFGLALTLAQYYDKTYNYMTRKIRSERNSDENKKKNKIKMYRNGLSDNRRLKQF